MSADERSDHLDELLFDEQMGLIEPANRDRLQEALSKDPALQAKRDRLADVVAPLDAWTPPPAPPNLAQSVMGRIAAASRTLRLERSPALPPSGSEASMMPSLMSVREVLAVAAAIMIIVCVFVPSYYGVRQRSQQATCAANMNAIGQGLADYGANQNGYLPFAGAQPGASWLPQKSPNAAGFSNTRHPFLVVKMGLVNPKQMICPGQSEDGPLSPGQYDALDDFESPNQISYSWHVQLKPMLRSKLERLFAIVADRTPYLRVRDGRVERVTDPTANSSAHGDNAGQNVLYPDGRVLWRRTPNVGVNDDNIWQAGHLNAYTGSEGPRDDNDSFLVGSK